MDLYVVFMGRCGGILGLLVIFMLKDVGEYARNNLADSTLLILVTYFVFSFKMNTEQVV